MDSYQKDLIQEHANLVVRIKTLNKQIDDIKDNTFNNIDKCDQIEFANKCIQLSGMKVYEKALRARLYNAGINYINNHYSENIGTVEALTTCCFEEDDKSDVDCGN